MSLKKMILMLFRISPNSWGNVKSGLGKSIQEELKIHYTSEQCPKSFNLLFFRCSCLRNFFPFLFRHSISLRNRYFIIYLKEIFVIPTEYFYQFLTSKASPQQRFFNLNLFEMLYFISVDIY